MRRLLARRLSTAADESSLAQYARGPLAQRLAWAVQSGSATDARRLKLARFRALAPAQRETHLVGLWRAYGVLEGMLDAEVEALETPEKEGELQEFSSLHGAAGTFWRDHGDALRRAPALSKALAEDHGVDEALLQKLEPETAWPGPTRQVARRVRAAATLNGDLLLGHTFVFHVVDAALGGGADDERLLGLAPTRNVDAPPLEETLAALDGIGAELEDDVYDATVIEATRALRLRTSLYLGPAGGPGLWRGAALGGARLGLAWAQEQAKPSAAEPAKEQAKPSAPAGESSTAG